MRHPQHPSFTTWFPIRLALVVLWLVVPAWALAKEKDQDIPLSVILDSVQPDLFTGTLTAAIPIEVTPGRQGLQPALSLAYSSANGNGWVGTGWKLELGGVERTTRFGVNYTGDVLIDDEFPNLIRLQTDRRNAAGLTFRTRPLAAHHDSLNPAREAYDPQSNVSAVTPDHDIRFKAASHQTAGVAPSLRRLISE